MINTPTLSGKPGQIHRMLTFQLLLSMSGVGEDFGVAGFVAL